uniref:Uncharacterized protein n=1 Tax=Moumouvirus sp. 'Monve' TaxID=1128131 RepID=H2EFA1_9VIRU|nr:hypothetical protein mv_R964 [Moumouvirus Monve]
MKLFSLKKRIVIVIMMKLFGNVLVNINIMKE